MHSTGQCFWKGPGEVLEFDFPWLDSCCQLTPCSGSMCCSEHQSPESQQQVVSALCCGSWIAHDIEACSSAGGPNPYSTLSTWASKMFLLTQEQGMFFCREPCGTATHHGPKPDTLQFSRLLETPLGVLERQLSHPHGEFTLTHWLES